jgi:hypothetical protein
METTFSVGSLVSALLSKPALRSEYAYFWTWLEAKKPSPEHLVCRKIDFRSGDLKVP